MLTVICHVFMLTVRSGLCRTSHFTGKMSVGFIGAGQLAHALVKGFTSAGKEPPTGYDDQHAVTHFFFFLSVWPGQVTLTARVHKTGP